MRWDALAAGMSQTADVLRFETHCADDCPDHPQGPAVTDSPGWMPDHDPYWIYYCHKVSKQLQQFAAECEPDLIAASGLEMTRYLSEIPASVVARRVIDIKDVESQLRLDIAHATRDRPQYADYASPEVARQLGALERAASSACDAVWTCTDRDRAELIDRYGLDPASIWVLPNAVAEPDEAAPTKPTRVVLIGNLRYFPVVQAAEYVIDVLTPALRRRRPALEILLAGRGPSEALADKAASAGVQIVADPEEMSPYWRDSVLVVPLSLGGGSRLKILEAFVSFCPVVSSAKGIEGITAQDGQHYFLAEDAASYVDAVLRLIDDDTLRLAMVQRAREFVLAHNGISAVAGAFADFIKNDTGRSRGDR
ncbi:glycosyltransferase family 4 protein [Dactylosporangium sp. NPDC051485]|uniref:glycosyltransferase family 4 protein n=1 Tax=Dactylosporangium sp. NPDC051485 TaxID=3154846 RepID=UPI0034349A17